MKNKKRLSFSVELQELRITLVQQWEGRGLRPRDCLTQSSNCSVTIIVRVGISPGFGEFTFTENHISLI